MSTLQLRESIFVRRPATHVFDYVADVSHARQWRAGVIDTRLGPGPLRPGSEVREVAIIAGQRIVTTFVVEEHAAPHRFSLRYRAGPVPVSMAYAVSEAVGGSVLHYALSVDLHGGWALLAPVLRVSGPRMMVESLDELRFRLEASALPLAS